MIHNLQRIDVTPKSYPFGSTVGKLDFEAMGYVEEEFFFDGTANVYQEIGTSGKETIARDIPYRNRLLVRRPADMENFSGNVVVEILNATAGFDIDRMWVLTARELMRSGAVYVGITSKPDMMDSLCLFDAERYSSISWKWEREQAESVSSSADGMLTPKHPECETGLFWDMLSDAARLLRTDKTLLPTEKARYLYLLGWSQSANYLTTYVRRFYEELRAETLFDGFLAAGNVHHFVTPLNQSGYGRAPDPGLTMVERMAWPFISVQTMSENVGMGGFEARQPDSDSAELKFRLYEIAGTTHDTKFSLLDYYDGDTRMEETGLKPQYVGIHPYPLDYPMEYPMYAIIRYLFRWTREGIAPPASQLMEVEDHRNRTDCHGNTIGGVRGVLLEAPLATYHGASKCDPAKVPMPENPLFGYTEYFTADRMKECYGTLAGYEAKAQAAAKALVEGGFLLAEDAAICVAQASRTAERLFAGKDPYQAEI